MIYITHRLDEVRQIADDVVVLRDGNLVLEATVGDRSRAELVEAMVGASVEDVGRPDRPLEPSAEVPRLVLRAATSGRAFHGRRPRRLAGGGCRALRQGRLGDRRGRRGHVRPPVTHVGIGDRRRAADTRPPTRSGGPRHRLPPCRPQAGRRIHGAVLCPQPCGADVESPRRRPGVAQRQQGDGDLRTMAQSVAHPCRAEAAPTDRSPHCRAGTNRR